MVVPPIPYDEKIEMVFCRKLARKGTRCRVKVGMRKFSQLSRLMPHGTRTPQVRFKTSQIPSNGDHKALSERYIEGSRYRLPVWKSSSFSFNRSLA